VTGIDAILDDVIKAEGGYVNHPLDAGGPTKFGITLATLSSWRGHEATAAEVQALTRAEALNILRDDYVVRPNFHLITYDPLRAQVVDAAVLHGPGWASRRLQEVAGVTVDGVVGPVTLRAVHAEPKRIHYAFCARRIQKLARIVRHTPSQLAFLVGWIDRATSFLKT
jgi:lysozyme family protein